MMVRFYTVILYPLYSCYGLSLQNSSKSVLKHFLPTRYLPPLSSVYLLYSQFSKSPAESVRDALRLCVHRGYPYTSLYFPLTR